MTKDNAKEFLPLVQALAEGKTIQVKNGEKWMELTNIAFDSDVEYYRILPTVVKCKCWAVRCLDGFTKVFDYEVDAEMYAERDQTRIMKEVEFEV